MQMTLKAGGESLLIFKQQYGVRLTIIQPEGKPFGFHITTEEAEALAAALLANAGAKQHADSGAGAGEA
jgi:hypothetical protein